MSIITSYDFSEDQNAHFLRQILLFLATQKMLPTPINYALSYEYISGSNKKLSAAIDSLIKQRKSLDKDLTIKLYNKFISDNSLESFEEINQDLETLINNTRSLVAETSQKASNAGIVFEEQAATVTSIKTTDDLQKVISEISDEATELATISQSLQEELDSANKEMGKLRKELIQVRESAATDALTGLLNRGAFDKALDDMIDQTSDNSESCLVMLDLDHFKQVNDTHGHLIGDSVLKFTGNLLRKHTESHHFSARYGGEELAIVMPNTTIKKSAEIAEKIRVALESSRLKKKNSSESIGKITVSIGISRLNKNDSFEDLIMRADKALYQAKETGRNKVVIE